MSRQQGINVLIVFSLIALKGLSYEIFGALFGLLGNSGLNTALLSFWENPLIIFCKKNFGSRDVAIDVSIGGQR